MKARWNNKGYSLVELLITLAIFGIVMIGIALIMRTTSVSYVRGNSEVAMQTEVQLLANQVEELLVDADEGFTKVANIWKIMSQGSSHFIKYDTAEDKLFYQKDSTDDDGWSLMAEYVTSFDINGWVSYPTAEEIAAGAVPAAGCDNMVTIEIGMNNDDHVYEVSRDVYFRNAIENPSVYQLGSGSGDDDDGTDTYTAVICLNRYSVLNLKKDYGIVTVTGCSSNFTSFYEFLSEPSYATGNKDLCYAINFGGVSNAGTTEVEQPDGSTAQVTNMTPYIRVNSTNTLSLGAYTATDAVYSVTGKTASGTEKTFRIYTEAVSYDINTSNVGTANGVVYLANATGDGKGGYTWIGVKGIDIASMICINGVSYKYTLVAYIDEENGDKKYEYSSSNKPGDIQTVNSVSHGYSSGLGINSSGVQRSIALKADPETNGFILVQDNNSTIFTDTAAQTAMSNGRMRLAVMIQLTDATSENDATYTVLDFALVTQGTSMANYKGANMYTMNYNGTTGEWSHPAEPVTD